MTETARWADGTTIAYERTGSGPPLVLVEGAFSDRRGAAFVAPLLADTFTVYTFEPPRARRQRRHAAVRRRAARSRTSTRWWRQPEHLAGVYGHSSGAVLSLLATAAGLPVTKLAVYEPPFMLPGTREVPSSDYAARVQVALDAGDRATAARDVLPRGGPDPRAHAAGGSGRRRPGRPCSPWPTRSPTTTRSSATRRCRSSSSPGSPCPRWRSPAAPVPTWAQASVAARRRGRPRRPPRHPPRPDPPGGRDGPGARPPRVLRFVALGAPAERPASRIAPSCTGGCSAAARRAGSSDVASVSSWVADSRSASSPPRERRASRRPSAGGRSGRGALDGEEVAGVGLDRWCRRRSEGSSRRASGWRYHTRTRGTGGDSRWCSTSSNASGSTSRISGTSQWPISEPSIGCNAAPSGLTLSAKAHEIVASSASQPKKNRPNCARCRPGRPRRSRGSRRIVGRIVALAERGRSYRGVGETLAAVATAGRPTRCGRAGSGRGARCRAASLVPAVDEITQQLHAPRHTAFEKREVQRGETVADTAEEDRLRERVAARGEVADVVEHVARRRRPQPQAL